MSEPIATIETRAAGVPALLVVTGFSAGYAPTYDDPGVDPSVEWHLADRRGRPAPWLERKLAPREVAELESAALDAAFNARSEADDDARIARYEEAHA